MISMDGKGRYIDNIFVERLWRSGVASNTKLMLHLAQRCLESTVPTMAGTQPDG